MRGRASLIGTWSATLLCVVAVAGVAHGGSGVLLGISSSDPAALYEIDPSTGQATFVTTLDGACSHAGLTALSGALYGSGLTGYPGAAGTDTGAIDPTLGQISFVSDQGGSTSWHGLASNETTGELYSIDAGAEASPIQVLDPVSGVVTTFGPGTNLDARGLAYDDANDALYATTFTGALHRVDTRAGTALHIGRLGVPVNARHGLAYDEAAGTLYLNLGAPVCALYRVDVTTGAATIVGSNTIDCTPGNGIGGLAWVLPAAPCPWDLDGGGVGITDLLTLLAAWGSDPAGPPDFDGDGVVGITDLLALLAAWGPCP